MSGLLPADTVLQLSTPTGDITHNGVLGSNFSGTPLLSNTFPTTSTGTSLGHYHYTDSTTKSLKFLNASGTGDGGHQFFHSSSTQSPLKVLESNRTATTIDTQLKNTSSKVILNMVSNDLTLTDDLFQSSVNCEAFRFKYNGAVNTQINNSPENPNVTFTSATTTSQLSASDLTFGGVSLPTRVTTAESDIDILTIKQTNALQVYNSSAVYADGRPPLAVPTTIGNSFGQFGWYFKNSFTSGGNKINWYQVGDIGMRVSDVLGLYMRYFNLGSTGVNDIPFIAIYTKTDTVTPNAASWYKSRLVLVPNFIPTINTSYTTQYKFISTTPDASHYNSTLNQMIYSTVGTNPNGAFAPTELINFFSISTSSSSAVDASEFIFQKLGIQTLQGTQEFIFQSLV